MTNPFDSDSHTVSYAPGSPLGDPRRLWREMRRDLRLSVPLAWRLFVRNFSARYRQTLFGYVWAFVPPLMTTLVFAFLRRSEFFSVPDTSVPYVVFLLTSTILWEAFADGIHSPIRMVEHSAAMLAKINFPREALILAGMGDILLNLALRLALLGVVLVWFGVPLDASSLVLFPFAVVGLAALGLAFGVLITPFTVLYRDIAYGLQLVLTLWMFLTPVVYPAPDPAARSLAMSLNPVSPVLDTARAWLLPGTAMYTDQFWLVFLLSLGALLVGWVFYRISLPVLIERMSA
jgi:lipopolysaccharide transport system permease protein